MAASSERGKRLLRRYPLLAQAPDGERAAIVRAALRHPVVLFVVVGGGLLLLPLYFDVAFSVLRIETEGETFMKLFKIGAAVLAPLCVLAPLLSRFLMPLFIRREMAKRGYAPPREEPKNVPLFKSRKK